MPTKILVWRQGEAQSELGKKILAFSHKINPGPSDNRIRIPGFNVKPDDNGDFISDTYSEEELDAINTFGIARYILELFEKSLGKTILWSWEYDTLSEPISIYIRNNGINARYNKEAKCIALDYFGPYENWTYYCRSTDIIAHETGHAILDSLKPLWATSNIETRGMAETFCDLSAMFFITSQIDLCEVVMKETNGDLRKKSILTEFGKGYGLDENKQSSIRSALNTKNYQKDLSFTYDFAEVLTGCLYDLLLEIIYSNMTTSAITASDLFQGAKDWKSAVIQAFIACDQKKSNLVDFQFQLKKYLKPYTSLIHKAFSKRQIIG